MGTGAKTLCLIAVGAGALLSGCGDGHARTASKNVTLVSAGATLPYPVYQKWFSDYHSASKGRVSFNYDAVGSGEGVGRLKAGAIDFAASDIPLTDAELKEFKIRPLHFPMMVGAVVPAYNLPGVKGDVKFTGDILARIYLGKIKTWDDPALTEINPDAGLPSKPIVVLHRSDASGTTFVWTHYLSAVSKEWQKAVGEGAIVKWPVGRDAKGSAGIAEEVSKTENSIGYVELSYAIKSKDSYGAVKNAEGAFVKADLRSTTVAADMKKELPSDFRGTITNPGGREAYPIATFTYLLVPSVIEDPQKKMEVKEFLYWALDMRKGQELITELEYAELPQSIAERATQQIKAIQ